jgi:hypothetical protein
VNKNPDDYENLDSARLLEAAAAWVDDADGFIPSAENGKISSSESWAFIATLLTAALAYE